MRFFLMPTAISNDLGGTVAPKYWDQGLGDLVGSDHWNMITYGKHDICIFRVDTDADLSLLSSQSDVITVPEILTNQVGAALNVAKAKLDAFNIPSYWLTANMTWRMVLRGVVTIFYIAQRFGGEGYGKLINAGVTLSTTWGELSQTIRDRLIAVRNSFIEDGMNFDFSFVDANTTTAQILRSLAVQWTLPAKVGGGEDLMT